MRLQAPISSALAAATEDLEAAGAAVPEAEVLAAEEALGVVAEPDGDEEPKTVVPLAFVLGLV